MAVPAKFRIGYAPQVKKGLYTFLPSNVLIMQNYKLAVHSVANISNRINFVLAQGYPQAISNGDTQTGNVELGNTS
jgi:hypothetical protein